MQGGWGVGGSGSTTRDPRLRCAAGVPSSALCWIRGVVAADKLRLEIQLKYFMQNITIAMDQI